MPQSTRKPMPRQLSADVPRIPRGPTRHEEYVRRVREALAADYATLHTSPLSELPGVVSLAQSQYSRKIFPTACALRALLDRAFQAAIEELDGVDDPELQQVQVYLQLTHQGVSVAAITRQLGAHSRSYVHREIQRQAFELITEAFLQLARQTRSAADASDATP